MPRLVPLPVGYVVVAHVEWQHTAEVIGFAELEITIVGNKAREVARHFPFGDVEALVADATRRAVANWLGPKRPLGPKWPLGPKRPLVCITTKSIDPVRDLRYLAVKDNVRVLKSGACSRAARNPFLPGDRNEQRYR